MKLTHLALVLTLVLLGVTGWIAWDEHTSSASARNKLALYEQHGSPEAIQAQEDKVLLEQMGRQPKSYAPPAPAMASVPPSASAPLPPPMHSVPPTPLVNSSHISTESLAAQPTPLTEKEREMQGAPAIGKVSEYQQQYGFVVVTAGANRKLETGMTFAVRHDGFIVGRIKITEVDNNSAIGDLVAKSTPDGVSIIIGDDVIQDLPVN